MRPKPILATLALAASLIVPSTGSAYVLGIGDRADGDPAASAQLGARVYRPIIDPDVPLATYDDRIYRFRAAGMEPQLVIGGNGTVRHKNRFGIEQVALAAYRRWPFAYSISVINEPDLAGVSVCGYARTYQRAYRLLKAAGVKRVLFGEFSPNAPIRWTRAILRRCGLRLKVDRFAWHAYDFGNFEGAITNTPIIRGILHGYRSRLGGHTPLLHVTEYGVPWRVDGPSGSYTDTRETDAGAAEKWRAAMRIGRRYLTELVAWDIHYPGAQSGWDSSIITVAGRERAAYHVIATADR